MSVNMHAWNPLLLIAVASNNINSLFPIVVRQKYQVVLLVKLITEYLKQKILL